MHLFGRLRNAMHNGFSDAHLAKPYVRGVEEYLWDGEALIREAQTLLVVRRVAPGNRAARLPDETPPARVIVGQHVFQRDCVAFPFLSGHLHVAVEVSRDVAGVLLNLVHHVRLVHDLELSVGHDLLEVVGEQLAAHVHPHHGPGDDPAPVVGHDVGEGVTRVHHQRAEGRGVCGGVVEGSEGRGGGAHQGRERVLLEEDFAEGFLDGREVEDGFGEDEVALVGAYLEDFCAKHVVPELSLRVPVHQVAFLERQKIIHT